MCFKRRFHRLIQDRDPPFKMWNLIIKFLYGLKQSPKSWYENLTKHILKLNFKHFNLDNATLFVKKVGHFFVYLVEIVDDILITGNDDIYIASYCSTIMTCIQ
jgi:hypothetical protein